MWAMMLGSVQSLPPNRPGRAATPLARRSAEANEGRVKCMVAGVSTDVRLKNERLLCGDRGDEAGDEDEPKFGREAREGAGIYPPVLPSAPLLGSAASNHGSNAQRMRRGIISRPPKRSSASSSLHASVDLAWQTIHGRGLQLGGLAQPASPTLQVEAFQQSGSLQRPHWCGNSWERVGSPGCGLGRHAVPRAKHTMV